MERVASSVNQAGVKGKRETKITTVGYYPVLKPLRGKQSAGMKHISDFPVSVF